MTEIEVVWVESIFVKEEYRRHGVATADHKPENAGARSPQAQYLGQTGYVWALGPPLPERTQQNFYFVAFVFFVPF